jgi:16S rRNA (uracil1498-N3)-methyltransferase
VNGLSSLYLRDDLSGDGLEAGDRLSVTGPEARHAVTVNRIRVGESVTIGNGRGLMARGPVARAEATELVVEVTDIWRVDEPSPRISLVQALAKGDRDELAIQAATELGIDRVVPWSADRSVSRWEGAKVTKGRDRWQSIVREATKQSIRAWLPSVGELVDLRQLVSLCRTERVLVLEPTGETPLSRLKVNQNDHRDFAVVVGPEGGISPNELAQLSAAGAEPVRLGASVLRTSSAGPAAVAVLNGILGRW